MNENDPQEKPQTVESILPVEPAEIASAGDPLQQTAPQEGLNSVELRSEVQEERPGTVRGIFIVIAAWFLPGLGHLMQRRLGRAMAGFIAVGAMAVAGLLMRGTIFPPHGDDAFGVLGFIADAGSGIFYLLAHSIEKNGADISRAAGDYGTRLLATSGVINMLFMLDALEISLGRKN
jgi:drug/metabolite transporter (DMT)-like permease